MTALRIRKNSNFVVLDKTCMNDVSLSLQAKGLHALLMGFPDDWKINLKDIVNRSSNGRDATRKAFSELELKGYIIKEQLRDGGKFGGVEYIVLEQPDLNSPPFEQIDDNISPQPENPYTVNSPRPGKPEPVNPTLLNNNNTKKNNSTVNNTVNLPLAKNDKGVVSDVISSDLDDKQRRYVKAMLNNLTSQGVLISSPSRVFEECLFAMKHSDQMKGVSSFKHRVNIISKLLRKGRWQTPKGFHRHSVEGVEIKEREQQRERDFALHKKHELGGGHDVGHVSKDDESLVTKQKLNEYMGQKSTQEKYLSDLIRLKQRSSSLVSNAHIETVRGQIDLVTQKIQKIKTNKESVDASIN